MPEVSTAARDIFLSALERATPLERVEFINKACGDDAALRQHVEALLRVHDEPDSLFDQSRINLKAPRDLAEESPATIDSSLGHVGTVIGPYKLLEQIGEGGFGVVFMAEQSLLTWARNLKSGGWIALTEIDDLFGHEPLSGRTKTLLSAYVEEGLAAGRYDFHMGRKLRDYLKRTAFTVARAARADLWPPDRRSDLAHHRPAPGRVLC